MMKTKKKQVFSRNKKKSVIVISADSKSAHTFLSCFFPSTAFLNPELIPDPFFANHPDTNLLQDCARPFLSSVVGPSNASVFESVQKNVEFFVDPFLSRGSHHKMFEKRNHNLTKKTKKLIF